MAKRQLSEKEAAKTFEALADALRSGMALVGYLDNPKASRIIDPAIRKAMSDGLRRGERLTDAVASWAGLSTAELSLLGAGERSGQLADAFASLARGIGERRKARGRLGMALAYPAFLIVMASVIMPLPTLATGGVGDYLATAVWGPLGVTVAAVLLFVVAPRRSRGGSEPSVMLRIAFGVPVIGTGLRCAARGTFADVLAQTLAAGVPMPLSLRCALASAPDPRLQAAETGVLRRITQGSTLTDALDRTGEFPRVFLDRLAHAEAVGTLDECLVELSKAEHARARAVVVASTVAISVVVVVTVVVAIVWGIVDAYRSYYQSVDDILRLQ
jgi:general secretion pathway protein F